MAQAINDVDARAVSTVCVTVWGGQVWVREENRKKEGTNGIVKRKGPKSKNHEACGGEVYQIRVYLYILQLYVTK